VEIQKEPAVNVNVWNIGSIYSIIRMSQRLSGRASACLVLQHPVLSVCQVPGYGDVKVSIESVPQSVVIGTTFAVNLKVINCSWVTFIVWNGNIHVNIK